MRAEKRIARLEVENSAFRVEVVQYLKVFDVLKRGDYGSFNSQASAAGGRHGARACPRCPPSWLLWDTQGFSESFAS